MPAQTPDTKRAIFQSTENRVRVSRGFVEHYGGTRNFDTVVWATGYRPDYAWLEVPGVAVDGVPAQCRGVTQVEGLYFVGLSWQQTRGSALLGFVDDDARWLVDRVSAGWRERGPSGPAPEAPRAGDAAP